METKQSTSEETELDLNCDFSQSLSSSLNEGKPTDIPKPTDFYSCAQNEWQADICDTSDHSDSSRHLSGFNHSPLKTLNPETDLSNNSACVQVQVLQPHNDTSHAQFDISPNTTCCQQHCNKTSNSDFASAHHKEAECSTNSQNSPASNVLRKEKVMCGSCDYRSDGQPEVDEVTRSPDLGCGGHTDEESVTGGPVFHPPVYSQRYCLVQKVLKENNVQSVVDFGSAECKIVHFFKNVSTVQHISLVDIDKDLLQKCHRTVKPDVFEFIFARPKPLTIRVFHGSAGDLDRRLVGVQAASLVEIIEHLEPETLKQVTHCVFGRLRPTVVIVTTPNADFNVLFPDFTGFRHWDHKFEWTREEFQHWCEEVCEHHGYSVVYTGVGDPPSHMIHLGFCSQAAIFTETAGKAGEQTQEETYELLQEEVYQHDKRTPDERLGNEVEYMINTLRTEPRFASDLPDVQAIIPLAHITDFLLQKHNHHNWTPENITEYLRKEYPFTEDDSSIIVQQEEEEESWESYEDYANEEPLNDCVDELPLDDHVDAQLRSGQREFSSEEVWD